MTWTPSDERWMRRALELAQKGQLTTWPNPMVGCVVVEGQPFWEKAGTGVLVKVMPKSMPLVGSKMTRTSRVPQPT